MLRGGFFTFRFVFSFFFFNFGLFVFLEYKLYSNSGFC